MFGTKNEMGWYLVRTKSRHGAIVANQLSKSGYECVYPTVPCDRFYCGLMVRVEEPVFADHVFVRTHLSVLDEMPLNGRVTKVTPLTSEALVEVDALITQRRLGIALTAESFPVLCEAATGLAYS